MSQFINIFLILLFGLQTISSFNSYLEYKPTFEEAHPELPLMPNFAYLFISIVSNGIFFVTSGLISYIMCLILSTLGK